MDLSFITLVGCVLEALVTMFSGMTIVAAPSISFGLLAITIAVIRWNFWGLTVIPFISLANFIGGHFNEIKYFAAIYDWRVAISVAVGLLVFVIDAIIMRKCGTKKVVSNTWLLLAILLGNYILFNIIQLGTYNLITSGNPFKVGQLLYQYNIYETLENGERVAKLTTDNLCLYEQNVMIYNLLGLRISIVGGIVLRSQGVLTNAYEKLVEDKNQADLDRYDEEHFSIDEGDASSADEELVKSDLEKQEKSSDK